MAEWFSVSVKYAIWVLSYCQGQAWHSREPFFIHAPVGFKVTGWWLCYWYSTRKWADGENSTRSEGEKKMNCRILIIYLTFHYITLCKQNRVVCEHVFHHHLSECWMLGTVDTQNTLLELWRTTCESFSMSGYLCSPHLTINPFFASWYNYASIHKKKR